MKKECMKNIRGLCRDLGLDYSFFREMANYFALTMRQMEDMIESTPDDFIDFLEEYSDYVES